MKLQALPEIQHAQSTQELEGFLFRTQPAGHGRSVALLGGEGIAEEIIAEKVIYAPPNYISAVRCLSVTPSSTSIQDHKAQWRMLNLHAERGRMLDCACRCQQPSKLRVLQSISWCTLL